MSEEKGNEKPVEEKVGQAFLLQSGVSFERLKDLAEFCEGIQDFVQYLGTNQYYSDVVNKKVFLLNLDVDACLLRLNSIHFKASGFRDFLHKVVCENKEAVLDSGELKAFLSSLGEVERESLELHARALELTEDIRREYRQKQGF